MHQKRGFTLIELLVVVSIIALLMAILLPTLYRARDQAKNAVCLENLRQWGPVFHMYTDDNNGYFTEDYYEGISEGDAMDPVYSFAGGHQWPLLLLPYYRDAKLRFCPMATKSYSQGAPPRFTAWIAPDLANPDDLEYKPCGSYGLNSWASNPPPHAEDDGFHVPAYYWRNTNVRGAHNIPLLLDGWWAGAFPHDTDEPPPHYDYVALGPEIIRFCIDRHNLAINALFMDFSVRKIGLKQLWQLKWHQTFDNTNGPWTPGGGCEIDDWPVWMRQARNYD